MFDFKLKKKSGGARLGEVKTSRGVIKTPVFMPVGTLGSVKGVTMEELEELGAQIILGNTYHLHLRPGEKLIKKAGGLHKFIQWSGPMLTDSGGFQVFSLGKSRHIDEDGVTFNSHIDGERIRLTPKKAMAIQADLGAEIVMSFDDVAEYPASRRRVEAAMKRTHHWLALSKKYAGRGQAFFGIIQGGMYPDLRLASTEEIVEQDTDGVAVGGLSVGEPRKKMMEMLDLIMPKIPENKLRYLMGVGDPIGLLEAIERGIDMFDCVLPTRLARHGLLYTHKGPIKILRSQYRTMLKPIDPKIRSTRDYTASYIHHLLKEKEILGLRLATLHNLEFILNLMHEVREAIAENKFAEYKKKFLRFYKER